MSRGSGRNLLNQQPNRESMLGHARLQIAGNTPSLSLLTRLRDRRTPTEQFAPVACQLATLALYHACLDLPSEGTTVLGFTGQPVAGTIHRGPVAGVVILRAGMIFLEGFRTLFPGSPLHQVGVRRDEASLEPLVYTNNLPSSQGWADRVFILDPMLATAGSALVTLELVRRVHQGRIDVVCLIAAPAGARRVLEADPLTWVTMIALDDGLDEHGYIVPGLGDAGDRFFGTGP
jgi:uracil phosphoribosyltransferase